MKQRTILLVEDEENVRASIAELLELSGIKVTAVETGEAALEVVAKKRFDLVLTDLRLPGIDGIEVIRKVRTAAPHTPCIIITGYASVETAVEAMRAGAFSYLKKPFVKDEMLVTLDKAFEVSSLNDENTRLKEEIRENCTAAILGDSPAIEKVCRTIRKVSDTDSTVLILGESGTGKELVAKALHYGSSRSSRPFVPINCCAIPEDLLESELFGYEKGAFTGAIAAKIGRFEAADQGTVFLDEIGDMSPALQVKILRVLQEMSFERIGGRQSIEVDVRVVAATNQNLELAVEEKRFRNDLFHRLNVIPIHLPPLRERRGDISLLVAHFIEKISKRSRRNIKGVSPEVMSIFELYDWPGNIRELENLMERLIILKEGEYITPRDLPEKICSGAGAGGLEAGDAVAGEVRFSFPDAMAFPSDGIDFNEAVDDFERNLIVNALARVKGVKKKAAEYLGLNRTTLIEKMKRKGLLDRPDSYDSSNPGTQ